MAKPKIKMAEPVETRIVVQQNNNVLYLILAVLVVSLAYMFVRMTSLEKKLATGGAGAQVESYVSVENLKKYAKEMKLDTGKFNSCLDKDEKKNAVVADTTYGSSVGVQGTPGFFINGRFLAGAFPFELFKEIIDKELAGTGSDNCTDYSEGLQQYCSDPQNQAFNPAAKQIDSKNAQATGPATAKVQIVEFSDFECPYCVRAYPTVKQILNEYKDQVRFYYMHYPLSQIHPNAQKAAEASLCAANQGKFWEYHDKLFESGLEGQQ
jgi:protein-disulfide isomerase